MADINMRSTKAEIMEAFKALEKELANRAQFVDLSGELEELQTRIGKEHDLVAELSGTCVELRSELAAVWGYFSPHIPANSKASKVITLMYDLDNEDRAKRNIYVWATPGPEVGYAGWKPFNMNAGQQAIGRFFRLRAQEVKLYEQRTQL